MSVGPEAAAGSPLLFRAEREGEPGGWNRIRRLPPGVPRVRMACTVSGVAFPRTPHAAQVVTQLKVEVAGIAGGARPSSRAYQQGRTGRGSYTWSGVDPAPAATKARPGVDLRSDRSARMNG